MDDLARMRNDHCAHCDGVRRSVQSISSRVAWLQGTEFCLTHQIGPIKSKYFLAKEEFSCPSPSVAPTLLTERRVEAVLSCLSCCHVRNGSVACRCAALVVVPPDIPAAAPRFRQLYTTRYPYSRSRSRPAPPCVFEQ